jgi:carbon storage regulator CsrA
MLVLRRRENESFVIFSGNKEIEVYVTEIDDNSVQIGIEADKDVTVFRREIVDKDNFFLPRASSQQ